MTEPPLNMLARWEDYGALWRVKSFNSEEAVVELCSCHGEPVDQLESSDPELLHYLARRPSSEVDGFDH